MIAGNLNFDRAPGRGQRPRLQQQFTDLEEWLGGGIAGRLTHSLPLLSLRPAAPVYSLAARRLHSVKRPSACLGRRLTDALQLGCHSFNAEAMGAAVGSGETLGRGSSAVLE